MCRIKVRDLTCSGILGLCYIVTCVVVFDSFLTSFALFTTPATVMITHSVNTHSFLHVEEQTTYHFEAPLWNLHDHKVDERSRAKKPRNSAKSSGKDPGFDAVIQEWVSVCMCMCVWSRAVRKNAWNDGILFLAGDESRAFSLVEVKGMRSACIMLMREWRHRVLATGIAWRGSPQMHKNTLYKNIFRKVYWHFLRNIEYEWIQSLVSCLDCK